jgi:hypothetical protein
VAGFCEYGNEPSGAIKKGGYYLADRVTVSFSKNILHHEESKYHILKFRGKWKEIIETEK